VHMLYVFDSHNTKAFGIDESGCSYENNCDVGILTVTQD